VRDFAFNQEAKMASDPIDIVRAQVGLRLSEIREAAPALSPLDLYARMEAIRQVAADHGLAALERVSRYSSQLALLPGHRLAMQSCLERAQDALDSRSPADCATILAALAIRLH
jgi:hypothetical protein